MLPLTFCLFRENTVTITSARHFFTAQENQHSWDNFHQTSYWSLSEQRKSVTCRPSINQTRQMALPFRVTDVHGYSCFVNTKNGGWIWWICHELIFTRNVVFFFLYVTVILLRVGMEKQLLKKEYSPAWNLQRNFYSSMPLHFSEKTESWTLVFRTYSEVTWVAYIA